MPTGLKKTMLGGSIIKKEDPGNGVPGPATYFASEDAEARRFGHIPGFKIMKDINVREEPKPKNGEHPVGPWKYSPKFPTHVSSSWKIGTGQRDEIKTKSNRIETPGPPHYQLYSQFDLNVVDLPPTAFKRSKTKAKFHMGVLLENKGARGTDTPGPGEYEIKSSNNGQAHYIGDGRRSDLGIGKTYLSPGPGQYNVRTEFDGKKTSFGREMKKNKLKKSYCPGPGSYDLPGTCGNIPKYLILSKQIQAQKIKRSKSAA